MMSDSTAPKCVGKTALLSLNLLNDLTYVIMSVQPVSKSNWDLVSEE